ncbi:MAG TPA: DNA methyltransferase [Elusimicrobia bacterium]|nr:DNA methyltransferase [Elusimicrobiota bacterium]
MKKYTDNSWDFRLADTKVFTHCFHNYPAMMIPQIAGRLIDRLGKKNDVLFDPYCGTGTSVVEANLRGISGIATDINPLARLITKAKSTVIPLQVLDFYLKDFNDFIFQFKFGLKNGEVEEPDFPNIDFWFTPQVKQHLARIKNYIDKIEDENVIAFFKVAFSETIRESSLAKNSEFKLVRMKDEQLRKFSPDVFAIFERKIFRNRNGLKNFIEQVKTHKKNQIWDFDTINEIPKKIIKGESIDLIVTSPPYGDSRTTVAYGQFSRLSNQWLGLEDASQVDNNLMGGRRAKSYEKFGVKELDKQIEKVGNKDEKRALDVISFYHDYKISISNVAKTIKPGGSIAYVVGNRRVKDEELPTDIATAKFFEQHNFRHIETIIRNIPSKRMPKENSPTNVTGAKNTTMNCEYIVVLKK